jgi:hypothetical protein
MRTKRGEVWANDLTPLPEDATGYLRQFAPGTDAVVLEYMTEALHTFINRNYFATAVMVGAASEAALTCWLTRWFPLWQTPRNEQN